MTINHDINMVGLYNGAKSDDLTSFIETKLGGKYVDTLNPKDGTMTDILKFSKDGIEVNVRYTASGIKDVSVYCYAKDNSCNRQKRELYQGAIESLYRKHYANRVYHNIN